jgi:hypothetical protein
LKGAAPAGMSKAHGFGKEVIFVEIFSGVEIRLVITVKKSLRTVNVFNSHRIEVPDDPQRFVCADHTGNCHY